MDESPVNINCISIELLLQETIKSRRACRTSGKAEHRPAATDFDVAMLDGPVLLGQWVGATEASSEATLSAGMSWLPES